jgi:acetate CoA/acetoacetate CoA-transferase alpha subunit
MIGSFMGVGSPHRLIDALVSRGAKHLTVVANDTARPGVGIGKLISAGMYLERSSHTSAQTLRTQRRMLAGELDVELVPQGTLAERIRAGGAGLGGVLTATGLGTADGKTIVRVGNRDFLLELPIAADLALVAARSSDYAGNLVYSLTARNFNPLMALQSQTRLFRRGLGTGRDPYPGRADRRSR